MYSPLNEDYMFQEMKDRTARLLATRDSGPGSRLAGRWWRKATHLAR